MAGLLAAAAAFSLVHISGGSLLGSALVSAWAEDVAFVGYFAVRAVREQSRHHKHRHWVTYYLFTFCSAFWSLFIELGLAETIDKFVRPALLYEIPRSLHNLVAGFIVAKLGADIVYYLLAYTGRRARIRYGAARDPAAVTEPGVTPIALDITDPERVGRVAEQCADVSLLVNNAGVMKASTVTGPGGREVFTPWGCAR